ncbi:MAG TPA: 16S rRNA (guanine(527)-N(7))-methyltransferase RsmG [Clostridia bacterium]|nr:16S rRNA (guanine(527)-N(7))-methyltransferase RsmG [Clostridia bacterium]
MKLEQLILAGAENLGLDLSEHQLAQFRLYYEFLSEWNKKINLTALVGEEEVAEKHFLDSLTCALVKNFNSSGDLVDIGTGAGFPGLPLKIAYPQLNLVLVDSLQKRTVFLKEIVEKLGLENVKIYWKRAEEFGKEKKHRESYEQCTVRAVAQLPVLLEYCLPILKVGGILIAQKGNECSEEIFKSEKALTLLGGEIVDVQEVKLPRSGLLRKLIVVKKIHPSPEDYPRRPGIPNKRPL